MTDSKCSRLRAMVVDDDSAFRSTLAKALSWLDIEVRLAENGLVAKTIFDLSPDFDIIISDWQMPELTGEQLLGHIRKTSEVPVILMSGYLQDGSSLPPDSKKVEFLKKPFGVKKIKEIIDRCVGLAPASVPAPTAPVAKLSEQDYFPIHIDDFISTTKLHSDVYVKLTGTKFIKVAHKNETIPVERLRTYRDRNVEFLYVTKNDFAQYVNFTLKVASTAMKSDAVTNASKAKLLKHTSEVLAERCFLSDIDESVVAPAKLVVESSLSLISEDEDILEVFTNIQSHSDRLYAHSVAVAVFSTMVAKLGGWNSSSVQFKLCLAGFFHDLGYKEFDSELLKKKRIQRTPADVKMLETHTSRSRDLIIKLKNLPEDISMIAFQHHETLTGTGYPLGLTRAEIHPLARLLATVDRFVERVIPISEEEPEKPLEALGTLGSIYNNDIEAAHLEALQRLFASR